MPCVAVEVSCPVYDSFRVQQVAGLFDVPLAQKATASFCAEVPGAEEDCFNRVGGMVRELDGADDRRLKR